VQVTGHSHGTVQVTGHSYGTVQVTELVTRDSVGYSPGPSQVAAQVAAQCCRAFRGAGPKSHSTGLIQQAVRQCCGAPKATVPTSGSHRSFGWCWLCSVTFTRCDAPWCPSTPRLNRRNLQGLLSGVASAGASLCKALFPERQALFPVVGLDMAILSSQAKDCLPHCPLSPLPMPSAVDGSTSAQECSCTCPAGADDHKARQSKDWSISIMTYNIGIPWNAPCTWGQADGRMALILQELEWFCKEAQLVPAQIHVLLLQDLAATSARISWRTTPHEVELVQKHMYVCRRML
jgi:hypothetical protein